MASKFGILGSKERMIEVMMAHRKVLAGEHLYQTKSGEIRPTSELYTSLEMQCALVTAVTFIGRHMKEDGEPSEERLRF